MAIKLDLKKFKKIHVDKNTTTLQHPEGHVIKISHSSLSGPNRKELDSLPMHKSDSPQKFDRGGLAAVKGSFAKATNSAPSSYYSSEPEPKAAPLPVNYAAPAPSSPSSPSDGESSLSKVKSGFMKATGMSEAHGGEIKKYDTGGQVKAFDEGGDTATEGDVLPISTNYPQNINQVPQAMQASNQIPGADVAPDESSDSDVPNQADAKAPGDQPPSPMALKNDISGSEQQQPSASSQVAPAVPSDASLNSVPGYMELTGAAKITAAAEQQLARQQQSLADKRASDTAILANHHQVESAKLNSEIGNFVKDHMSGQIDANRYMNNMSTGKRMQTSIGLILAGAGAGMNRTANPALGYLQQQINNDIEAQKADLGRKNSILGATYKQMGNLRDATDMSRLLMNGVAVAQLDSAGAQAQDPLAKARALKAIGDIKQSMIPIANQLAMRQVLGQVGNNPALSKIDPALLVTHSVPPDKQKEVFGSIEAAQNTKRMSDFILNTFNQAAKDNTVLKTGAGLLRTPASVFALHQAMQPTFKDLEGTVRQAAMDNTFNNITPKPGDTDSTIATKRMALVNYLQSKASAPMAKGFGIDLSKFDSTAPAQPAAQIKIVNGIKYMRGPSGEAIKVQ